MSLDRWREWFTIYKFMHFLKVIFLKKYTTMFARYNYFGDVDCSVLSEEWKKWIILDVDWCITYFHWQIIPENIDKIKEILDKWLNIVIFSNMKKTDRYNDIEKLWINVCTSNYPKPDPKWFLECVDMLWLTVNEVVMVWDNFMTDWWAIWCWIDFVKIDKVKISKDFKLTIFDNILWKLYNMSKMIWDVSAKIHWNQ